MKEFDRFIEEAAAKRCPSGQYWCYTDKKCKKIPTGYRVGFGGRLAPDNRSDSDDDNKNGNIQQFVANKECIKSIQDFITNSKS